MLEVTHKQGQGRTFFILTENGNKIGTLSYTRPGNDNVMVIQTVLVDEGNEGKDYGRMLVDAAVAFAKQNNLQINPMCSFAKNIIMKSDDYKKMLV